MIIGKSLILSILALAPTVLFVHTNNEKTPYKKGQKYDYKCSFTAKSGFKDEFSYNFRIKSVSESKVSTVVEYDDQRMGKSIFNINQGNVWMYPPINSIINFAAFTPFPEFHAQATTWEDTASIPGILSFAVAKSGRKDELHKIQQYANYAKQYPHSVIYSKYYNTGQRDTIIGGKHYSAYIIRAHSMTKSPDGAKIDHARGNSLFLYSPEKGFEYMEFSLADSLHAVVSLDKIEPDK